MCGSKRSLSSSRMRYDRDAGAPPSSERWWTKRMRRCLGAVGARAATSRSIVTRASSKLAPVLFNSYEFILGLLPVYLVVFFLLRRQTARLVWTVCVSYAFYGWGTHWLPVLMATSTVIAYIGGRAIGAAEGRRRQVTALVTSVAGVLVLLLYFKYAGFGAYYLSRVATTMTGTGLPTLV